MDFLTERNIYHGDLDTRNVLLRDISDPKIYVFVLSVRIYNDINTAQQLRKNDVDKLPPLPNKWVALGVLLLHEYFLEKSDVLIRSINMVIILMCQGTIRLWQFYYIRYFRCKNIVL